MGTFRAPPGHRSHAGRRNIPDPPGDVNVDVWKWPITLIQFGPTPWKDEELQAYLDWLHEYVLGGEQRYLLVMDQRKALLVNARQRKILTDHMHKHKAHSDRYCAGSAMVFESVLLRGFMTAIFWVFSPGYPTRVFARPEDGMKWCEELLQAEQTREATQR